MTTTEVQELIGDMPLTDEVKQEILSRQEAGAPPEDILNLIAVKLDGVERELIESTPEGAAMYQEAMDTYEKEVASANGEFERKMKAIEEQANAFGTEIGKEVDAARMQELMEERNKITG